MRKREFTEEQIAAALKQAELGISDEEVCLQMGISDATSTSGTRSAAASGRRSCGGCVSPRKRTASSSRSWPI